MTFSFTATGHKNVLCSHRNTIEFTHDKNLTLRGDCILGVNAGYSLKEIKKQNFSGKIRITLQVDKLEEEIIADYNPDFEDSHEMVLRRTGYMDKRTFGINATKIAKDIKRDLVEKMKNPDAVLAITIKSEN